LFTLHSKVRAKNRGHKFPQITKTPSVFEYREDPDHHNDYGQIFGARKENPSKLDPSMSLYALREGNLVWVDKKKSGLFIASQGGVTPQ
jgi:hypothetical protein